MVVSNYADFVAAVADHSPRIVQVNDIRLEAGLASRMLYVNNEDKPGFIGSLGKLLGEASVNIANFHLGRSEAGKDAIALVEVDQNIAPDVLAKIASLPSVHQAKVLTF